MATYIYIAAGVSCGVLLAVGGGIVVVLVRKRQSRRVVSMECRARPLVTSLYSHAVSSDKELKYLRWCPWYTPFKHIHFCTTHKLYVCIALLGHRPV